MGSCDCAAVPCFAVGDTNAGSLGKTVPSVSSRELKEAENVARAGVAVVAAPIAATFCAVRILL